MADEHECAAFLLQPMKQPAQLQVRLLIESRVGIVKSTIRGERDQRPDDRETLEDAARQNTPSSSTIVS